MKLQNMLWMTASVAVLASCQNSAQSDAKALPSDLGTKSQPSPTSTVPPARDPNIAVREELDMAIAKNTREAYELFIARHPKHDLVKEAKTRMAALSQ